MAEKSHLMSVEAEISGRLLSAQLVDFHFEEPPDNIFSEDHRLRFDLSLTPRPSNARACYPEHWGGNRFEPLGKLFVVPPGESLRAKSDACGDQRSLLCQLDPIALSEQLEKDVKIDPCYLAEGLDVRNDRIKGLLVRLAEEVRHPGFASTALVDAIAVQLSVELLRNQFSSREQVRDGGLASWRLKLIDERLTQLGPPPNQAELAGLCDLSVRQLSRGFQASRGRSLGEHISDRRIGMAKQRLTQGQNVKAVAYALGFSSPSSFSYAFRRATGQTPSQFRSNLCARRKPKS